MLNEIVGLDASQIIFCEVMQRSTGAMRINMKNYVKLFNIMQYKWCYHWNLKF